MMRLVPAILLLLASSASATEPYCQISGNGSSSGCAIAVNEGVASILTCAHGKKPREKLRVRFRRTDRWLDGVVTAYDFDRDLAIVKVWAPPLLKVVAIADETPESGTVTIAGYGNREFQEHRTKIAGPYTAEARTDAGGTEFIRVEGTGRFGDSGAPVLARGKIVGVNVRLNYDTKDALFVPVERVREFLEGIR